MPAPMPLLAPVTNQTLLIQCLDHGEFFGASRGNSGIRHCLHVVAFQRLRVKNGDSLVIATFTPSPSYKSMCVAPATMNSSFGPAAFA